MSTSSSASSTTTKKQHRFKVGTDGSVYCNHDMIAICRVAGIRSKRQGHEFYGCPLWPGSDCKFFIWKEDVDVLPGGHLNFKMLEMKNKTLELKVENLEAEKMLLEEENKTLKIKLLNSKSSFFSNKINVIGLLSIVIAFYLYIHH